MSHHEQDKTGSAAQGQEPRQQGGQPAEYPPQGGPGQEWQGTPDAGGGWNGQFGQPGQPGQYGQNGQYGQYGQSGRYGPDMGQPHFAAQIPGAQPYQGAPQAQAGYTAFAPHFVHGAPPSAPPPPQGYGAPLPGREQAQPRYARYAFAPQGPQPVQGPQAVQGAQPAYAPNGQQYGPALGYGYAPQPPYHGYAPAPDPGPVQGQYQHHPHHQHHPGHEHGKGQEYRYGELYGLIQEAANGNADVAGFLRFFQSSSSDFWKGALVGGAVTLLLTNETVKNAIAGALGGVLGCLSRSAEDQEAEEDRKAEARLAKEQQA